MDTDTDLAIIDLENRWLKFNQNRDHCPECGEWNVRMTVTTYYSGKPDNPIAVKYWRWHCVPCGSIWMDPKYAKLKGNYWNKALSKKQSKIKTRA